MPRATEDKPIDPRQLGHLKKLRHILPLLAALRDCGCERDRGHNRELHFDQYVTLVLLYLFNPLIDSMRVLQEAAAVEKISEQLGVGRFSLGSFSESVRVFEPERLKAVIEHLAGELKPLQADPRLKQHIDQVLTIVDGTVLDALVKVARAFWLNFSDGTPKHAWRLHVQFDLELHAAVDAELTDARNSGPSDEKNVLLSKLKSDHCYVMDRGFTRFTLFNAIHKASSSYVCRMRDWIRYDIVEERLLSDGELSAGVVRDALVNIGTASKPANRPDHPVRLVVVEATPHQKRGGRKGKTAGSSNPGTILIATNLLDVPAEIIALIYRYRWTIEVFFRFFKQTLGCRHLISQRVEGIEIQVYCALIACMLINLWTGKKPGKHMINMLAWYFMGIATEKEVEAFLARPDNTGVKLRQREAYFKSIGL